MPHQCTSCGRTFDDGSKEMLSGCPGCGGNKFQFRPGDVDDSPAEPAEPADPPDPPDRPGDPVSRTVGNAAATVRDFVSGSSGADASASRVDESGDRTDDSDVMDGQSEPVTTEDDAQADARSTVVEPGDIPPMDSSWSEDERTSRSPAPADRQPAVDASGDEPPRDGTVADTPDPDQPDLAELREELNDQFESIRVLAPGQYELNLMELYDREEYIIALQEDGRYSIRVPETIGEVDA